GNVVIFENGFADIEVTSLDLALGFFDGVADHPVLDGFALLHPQGLHDVLHPIGGEDPHQVVFERQGKTGTARIALTPRTAPQRFVDPPRSEALGAGAGQAAWRQPGILTLLPFGLHSLRVVRRKTLPSSRVGCPSSTPPDAGTTTGHIDG